MQNKNIILVEDNLDIAQMVELHLKDMGHDISVFHNGSDAWGRIRQNDFDLIILDIMLPGMDGLEILKKIRANNEAYKLVLMLTSKSSEMDRVLGLELGADDYLTKPFSLMELVARVKALFRRGDAMHFSGMQHQLLKFTNLSINPETREVLKKQQALELTAKEFDLLLHFALHPGQVFNRTQLLNSVWGYGHDGYEHTVNSHINRLRSKLEFDPAKPDFIQTVWGVGYQFNGNRM